MSKVNASQRPRTKIGRAKGSNSQDDLKPKEDTGDGSATSKSVPNPRRRTKTQLQVLMRMVAVRKNIVATSEEKL